MRFSIDVWNLYAHSDCSCRFPLSCWRSTRLVAACAHIPEFIHTHTNPTAIQEKLHERSGCFIVGSNGVADATSHHTCS